MPRSHSLSKAGARAVLLLCAALAACQPPSGAGPVAGPRDEPEPAEETARAEPAGAEVSEPGRAAAVPSGSGAMRRVDPSRGLNVRGALLVERGSLVEALDLSLEWFEKPSSREYFPVSGITHEHARASAFAFRELLLSIDDAVFLEEEIRSQFDFYQSVGSDGRGKVLFTGYYSPVFDASRTRGGRYQYPLYTLPDDLVVDSTTRETLGRRVGDGLEPYPTRAVIEGSGMLAGYELAYLTDPFEVYLVHIQGSAALSLPDGSTMQVGYAGTNGQEYVSVARLLVAEGKIREDELSLDEVRGFLASHPDEQTVYLRRNKRFVFFQEVSSANWPAGSLGVRVIALRSIATDKKEFPPGGVTLVLTDMPNGSGGKRRVSQFMLDQDSGGAIQTPGRADIYYGIGLGAERLAGDQYSEGELYYLFLKPNRLSAWLYRLPPLP